MTQKSQTTTLRDAVIREITARMARDKHIFFLSGDFGAPALDDLVKRFPSRFINVGIAEQNLINVATGLAMEGYTVFAYGIAPFVSMRCIEQVRINLSLLKTFRSLAVCVIGVGPGYSYDLSGPTHQSLEDAIMMRALPGISVLNPCDAETAVACAGMTLKRRGPCYLRLDGRPQPTSLRAATRGDLDAGFRRMGRGRDVAIVATGCMTHVAVESQALLQRDGILTSVFDLFALSTFDEDLFSRSLRPFPVVATCEEGFLRRGGLDSIVLHALASAHARPTVVSAGVKNAYTFENLTRAQLQAHAGLTAVDLVRAVQQANRRCGRRSRL